MKDVEDMVMKLLKRLQGGVTGKDDDEIFSTEIEDQLQ